MTAIGVPIKVLHEAEGHIITLETCVGEFRFSYKYSSSLPFIYEFSLFQEKFIVEN